MHKDTIITKEERRQILEAGLILTEISLSTEMMRDDLNLLLPEQYSKFFKKIIYTDALLFMEELKS